ncbi:hypothetical protein [Amycolatopsis sp. WGS_07]|uniref:hypothetical protein n=1 Tax=Amycolatopsis sp. WGS_07 TaxID=3076764 RepID=UPI003873CAAE
MREEDRSSASFADDLLSDELLNDPALAGEPDLATEIFAVADAPRRRTRLSAASANASAAAS